ncbi:MAG TPA: hypothetical protein VGE13_02590 [Candidatus Saccharimonadales bacterium]
MEPDDKKPNNEETPADSPAKVQDDTSHEVDQAPADALSRTPDDLEEEQAAQAASKPAEHPDEKKVSPLRRFFRRANVYFLFFVLICVIAGAVVFVGYLNSQKPAPEATVGTQELTEEALKQLSKTNASIGSSSQTLTIQGNATIAGQTLMRGGLSVAGNFQTGGSIQGTSLRISGSSELADTRINKLEVSGDAAIQGSTTMRNLSVSGTTSLNGAVTASQLTVSRLTLSGNAVLQIPNHLSFTGPTPGRSNGSALGNGGSASISGSDTSGTVNVRTGNNPSAGCFTRITFRQAFNTRPHVIVSPIGNAAGKTQYYVDRDNSGFSICTVAAAPGNQTFAFDYFVAG